MYNNTPLCFLAADREDNYFTEHLLKLDFEQYIYYLLKRKEYKDIFFIDSVNMKNMKVSCEDKDSMEAFNQEFGKRKNIIFKKNSYFTESDFRKRKRFELNDSNVLIRDTVKNLIMSNDEDKFVFIFSEYGFKRLYPTQGHREEWINLIRDNSYQSLFLIVKDQNDENNLQVISKQVKSVSLNWRKFDKNQLERMLQRVCLHHLDYYRKTDINTMLTHVLHGLKDDNSCQIFERSMKNKKELYEELLTEHNLYYRILQSLQ